VVITVRRSGGFAGQREKVGPMNTANVANGAEIEAQVEAIGFFDLPAELPPAADALQIPDAYYHEVEVVDGERQHAVGIPGNAGRDAAGLGKLIGLVLAGGAIWQRDRSVRCHDWFAWRDAEGLHVSGSCEPPLGWHVVLEPAAEATEGTLALKSRLEQGFAETGPVLWTDAATQDDVTEVRIAGSVNASVPVGAEPPPPPPPVENFP
jgi:hypothetical protein